MIWLECGLKRAQLCKIKKFKDQIEFKKNTLLQSTMNYEMMNSKGWLQCFTYIL
jgi:hypothetical protein